MKIRNDYVKLKFGKREIDFNNLILDTYLFTLVKEQSDFNLQYWDPPFLNSCYIKFDRKLEFNETSILYKDDFDVEFDMENNFLNTSTNKIEIEYIYKSIDEISSYYGKKITAIGFFEKSSQRCYACLDLSDYSVSIKNGEELAVVRKDTFSTDATFTTNSPKVKYPLHLCPLGYYWNEENPKTTQEYPYFERNASAYLESVGLGTNKNIMQKEIPLTTDNTIYFGKKIIFKDIFNIENIVGLLEPGFKYPSNNLYPIDTQNNFTYVFLKFKLYYNIYDRIDGINYQHVDTGCWYTLSIPVKATGDFNYAIIYERSDKNGI